MTNFNPLESLSLKYSIAILVFLVYTVVLRLVYIKINEIIGLFINKTKTDLDDQIIMETKRPIFYLLLFLGVYLELIYFNINEGGGIYIKRIVLSIMTILIAITIYRILNVFVGVLANKYLKEDETAYQFFSFTKSVVRITFWILAFFQVLTIWNINITPLLASAGVAGLAIALAAQTLIGNMFGGVSLFLDKTLKVGDRVIYNGKYMFVDEVNIRTTKFRTLENTYYIVPNSKLANDIIENVSAPYNERKVVRVKVSVAYGSNIDKVKKILKKVAEKVNDAIKDSIKVYFIEMGDFSLDFLVTFQVEDASKMWTSKIEFLEKIYKEFEKEGIEIPFPTQTIYLKKE